MSSAPISRPEFVGSDYEYRFYWADEGVRVLLERFYEAKGELNCEIVIDQVDEANRGRPTGRLHGPAKVNLIADRTLGTLARRLGERLDIDWDGLFTQMKALAIRQYREGEPLIDLSEVELDAEQSRYLLPPFIDQHGVSLIVADGGTGKSLTALAMAVAVACTEPVFGEYPTQHGPVVFFDWEADPETHAERLHAICRGLEIPVPKGLIHYQRMVSSLPESIATLRKKVLDVGAVLVAGDSVGMARGGGVESGEDTIKLFRGFRSFDVPVLAVDHISKETKKGDQSAGVDPIGSIYTRNSARLVWSMEGKQFEGRDDTVIVFRNSKANFGRKERQRAYRYEFREGPGERLERVTFTPVDWRDTEEFADRVPVKDRIIRILRPGALTRDEIAAAVDISSDAARARLSELLRAGRVIRLEGDRWGLGAVPREDTI